MENININDTYQVIKPYTSLRLKPDNSSLLETECLYGETVKIIKKKGDWLNCILLTDNYEGWIKKSSIGNLLKPNHRIIVSRTFIYSQPIVKSNVIFELSLGCRIYAIQYNQFWFKVFLDIDKSINIGYVPKNHIIKCNQKYYDWVKIAENLIHTPYKWGGRSALGLDCSALVQLSLQTQQVKFPRNTSLQKTLKYPIIQDLEGLERGMLIFWDGHVAISLDKDYIIHANAYHMNTIKEPILLAKKRIAGRYGNINLILDLRNV